MVLLTLALLLLVPATIVALDERDARRRRSRRSYTPPRLPKPLPKTTQRIILEDDIGSFTRRYADLQRLMSPPSQRMGHTLPYEVDPLYSQHHPYARVKRR